MSSDDFRASLVSGFEKALATLDPAMLVSRALGPRRGGRVLVIAAGKAALRMADGVHIAYPDPPIETLAIVPAGSASRRGEHAPHREAWSILVGAHPALDERSLAAGAEALKRARALSAEDQLIALISGGASSVLAALPDGMTLERKQEIVRALLDRGAPITDVNTVRRHVSPIKGGGLARAAVPARVTCLAISDVVAGRLCDIGSGPAASDPTSRRDALTCIRRWIPEQRANLEPFLRESFELGPHEQSEARVLADPSTLGEALGVALTEHLGLATTVLAPEAISLDAAVERRIELARKLAPGHAIILPCEPTVALPPGRGRGGRAGRVALQALTRLPPTVFLLCAASDGVDGSSGTAGAVVCGRDLGRIDAKLRSEALADFDDARAHRAMGTSIRLEPTGTNLTDVHVLARPIA